MEALVAVEEDGDHGGGAVRVDSEGLFKGLAVGLAVFRHCWQPHRTASPVNRRFWCWVFSDDPLATHQQISAALMHLLVLVISDGHDGSLSAG